MTHYIEVPIFVPSNSDSIGGSASISDRIRAVASTVVNNLPVDDDSLRKSIDASLGLIEVVRQQLTNVPHVSIDTFGIQLGIASTGKVGFSGTGVDVEFVATLQIDFKVEAANSNKGAV